MNVFTIGFTRKSARRFFELVRLSGAKRIVDVRLNNASHWVAEYLRDHWGGIDIDHLGLSGASQP